MEKPLHEPMKHRFKKRHFWKLPHEVVFEDDVGEFSNSGKNIRRETKYKPHSHAAGLKPRWRLIRKWARREAMVVEE